MLLSEITPEQSHFYNKLILDYLNGANELAELYQYRHRFESFEKVIAAKQFDAQHRKVLCDVLNEQYAPLKLKTTSAVAKQLELLASENTYTVTTGHQLCLLTGPSYFLYKIIHTIKLATDLKIKYPEKNFVPVYWMASEDHDFEEIKSININGKSFNWNHSNTTQPVGRYDLEEISQFFESIESNYEIGKVPEFLIQAKSIYTNAITLSEATFKLVHHLFEAYGLVVIEPDNKLLKEELKMVMREDIFNGTPFEALQETGKVFTALKHKQQVAGRDINFFYLHENGRLLINKTETGFIVGEGETVFTKDEMKKEIDQHPERFSPNVVLRPVYQEIILPNLAYVGGPGEVAYWLQLKGVFEKLKVSFPLVLIRNSFAILTHKLKHDREKIAIVDEVYFGKLDRLHVEVLNRLIPTSEDDIVNKIGLLYQSLIDQIHPINNGISSSIIKQKKITEDYFESLIKQLRKSKAEIEKYKLEKAFAIRSELFVNATPAERVYNFLHYSNMDDPQVFISMIYNNASGITNSVKLMAY